MPSTRRLLFTAFVDALALLPAVLRADDVVRVFVLAGQSNMEGKAPNELFEHQATAPATDNFFARFRRDGRWVERDDVFIRFLNRHGRLTLGYGSRDRTGVELAFGTLMGDHYDEPVLLIKAAWGGRSLVKDFRPPSAGLPSDEALAAELQKAQDRVRKENEQHERDTPLPMLADIKQAYGRSYRAMLTEVRTTLNGLDQMLPELAGRRPELTGLVWLQGWNDMYGGQDEYASNLRHLIHDVRRDLAAPGLPVVIAAMGQNGSQPAKGAMLTVQQAQLTVQDLPEFDGSVRSVRTDVLVDKAAEQLFPEWRDRFDEWKLVGGDRPYHYFGSPIWFCRMGDALGAAMLQLVEPPSSGSL